MPDTFHAGPNLGKLSDVTIIHGDCLEAMAELAADSVDAIVTDPPYGLGFMGKAWDELPPGLDWAKQCLRVLKPGGHLLAFGGTRTWHRLAVAVEDAGFEIRDSIAWLYGCLSDDTEILTSDGWVRYDRATTEQHALAFDPETGALEWQQIQHVHRYHHDGEMVRLHSEHTDQLLTPNHRVILDGDGRLPYVPQGVDPGALCGLRNEVLEAQRLVEEVEGALLLAGVQRSASRARVEGARTQGASGLDRREPKVLQSQDDRRQESGMEGRRYRVQEARELCRSAVRAGAGVGAADGTQGRLHNGAPATNGRDVWVSADPRRGGEPREPRPTGQSPGELDALAVEPDAQAVRVGQDARRNLLPSTTVEASWVDYAGVVWCITVPHGAFLARRNGLIFATGNSGFPKSLDVSKAIDKAGGNPLAFREFARAYSAAVEASPLTHSDVDRHLGIKSSSCYWAREDHRGGMPPRHHWEAARALLSLDASFERLYAEAEREVIGQGYRVDRHEGHVNYGSGTPDGVYDITAPATPEAAQWSGWGTALKPAWEGMVTARKPFNLVSLDSEVNRLHHLLGGLIWLSLSPAKRAELSSPSRQAEPHEVMCASALAAAAINRSPGESATTVTFNSLEAGSTSLSIATSWSSILDVLSDSTTTSTTSTASSMTTGLRILSSLLAPLTSQTTTPRCDCLSAGSRPSAPSAASASSDEWANWLRTLSASAPESVTYSIAQPVALTLASIADGLSSGAAKGSSAPTPATDSAGGSLEPVVVARKPIVGTVAANVLAHGTGALNIDGCRIETTERIPNHHGTNGAAGVTYGDRRPYVPGSASAEATHDKGRWPANVVLDNSQAVALDEQSGTLHSQNPETRKSKSKRTGVTQMGTGASVEYADAGGASRFFYVAKAPKRERPVVDGVAHPTVKPLALMRWLVRLVTPPGGIVLDPFAGSGTTLEAAVQEGFAAVGIEREADYLPMIQQRIARTVNA